MEWKFLARFIQMPKSHVNLHCAKLTIMGLFLIALLNRNLFSTTQLEWEISIYEFTKGLSSELELENDSAWIYALKSFISIE